MKKESIRDLLVYGQEELKNFPKIEAEIILENILGVNRAYLFTYPEKLPSEQQKKRYLELISRRKENYPLQYLIGQQNFMGLDFLVDESVLIPRFDTEVLVEEVLKVFSKERKIDILDLCTGSGAISVSLAKFLVNSQVVATDISEEALELAKKNALKNKLENIEFLQGDLWQALGSLKKFDLITSNPPYITTEEMEDLPADVKKEPHLALWGGDDGLDFYRRIVSKAKKYLKEDGFLFLEIGYKQAKDLEGLCLENGFVNVEIIKDYQGLDRVIKAF